MALHTLHLRIFLSLAFLGGNISLSAAAEELPAPPKIPAGCREELVALAGEINKLVPGTHPLETLPHARDMLRELESWRARIDDPVPPGWREKIKQFSISCDLYDKRLRLLQSKSRISPEDLADWDRFYQDEARPLWVNSMDNMQSYHALMSKYRNAARFWKAVVNEREP